MKKPVYFRSITTNRIIETNSPEFYEGPDYECIDRRTGAVLQQEEARSDLLELLKPGQTVYSQIMSVSASGGSRNIKFYCIADGQLINITHYVARLLGYRMRKYGLIVNGGGMDMCFSVVYNLGRKLWETIPGDDAGYSLTSRII